MKRILTFNDGIISGYDVRSILDVFPEIESNFRQRKTYDEYYYTPTSVELTIEKLKTLSEHGYEVTIYPNEVVISE